MTNEHRGELDSPSADINWRDMANCLGMDPEVFEEAAQGFNEANAKAACGACAVRRECLNFAMEFPRDANGMIFGGLTTSERRRFGHLV